MSSVKKLAGQTIIYGFPTILGRLLNYLLVPLYTRVFLPEEYGTVTEMYAYVAFLFVVLTYGMETAFFRYSQTEKDKQSVYSTAIISLLFSSVVFIALCVTFSGKIGSWMGYASHPEYIVWFSLILAFDAISSIPYAKLREQEKAGRFALIKFVNIGINIGLNLFFIILCPYLLKHSANHTILNIVDSIYNPAFGIGYIFIANLAASAITLVMLFPELFGVKLTFDRLLWKRMLAYAWPFLIVGFAGIINETLDRILLKHLLPDKETAMAQLGIYGACYKISIVMTLFIQTYRYAAEPFFFARAKEKGAQQMYATLMNYFVIVCSFIFLVIMMYIDVAILFVGKEFREGAAVIPILLLANLFLGIYYNLSVWYKITGQTLYGAAISVFGAIITLVLNFALIPVIGYMGAAWATFICYGLMMVAGYVWGQKHYPVPYSVMRNIFYILLVVALYVITIFIHPSNDILRYAFNTLLVGLFILIIILREKRLLSFKTVE